MPNAFGPRRLTLFTASCRHHTDEADLKKCPGIEFAATCRHQVSENKSKVFIKLLYTRLVSETTS